LSRLYAAPFVAGLFMTGPAAVSAQSSVLMSEVRSAVESGDARALVEFGGERIEVTLFGMSTVYTRSQAAYVLADFFRQFRPRNVELYESSRASGHWFISGTYHYRRGEQPLQILLRFRAREGDWELREIRIASLPRD
jgi:hypothetical protein